jgi:hypothetical protein
MSSTICSTWQFSDSTAGKQESEYAMPDLQKQSKAVQPTASRTNWQKTSVTAGVVSNLDSLGTGTRLNLRLSLQQPATGFLVALDDIWEWHWPLPL